MTKLQLLSKVRELITYFHGCGERVSFADIGELAQRILDASVHILSLEAPAACGQSALLRRKACRHSYLY